MNLKIKLSILDNLIWVILLVLIVINLFITPMFFTYGNLINIIYHSAVLGFLVLAEGLCLMTGNFDLSIESTLAFAPAIAILFMTRWIPGLNPIIGIIITLVVGMLIGYLNGIFVGKLKINPFLQTLSILIILRGLTYYLIPMSVFNLPRAYTFLGGERTIYRIPIAVILLIIFVYIIHVMLTKTVYGRSLIAVGGNIRASFISGIDTEKVLVKVFTLSGLFAAIAGLLSVGRQEAITNAMGNGLVFMAFAASIMGGVSLSGGIGTVSGMLGGLLVLGVIDNSLTMLGVNVFLVYAIKGILIFIAVLLDHSKIKIREKLIYKEEAKKFKAKMENVS